MTQEERELVPRQEFLPELPQSGSMFGEVDLLNSKKTSEITLDRVRSLIDDLGLAGGVYTGVRMVTSKEEYRWPLMVFDTNPVNLSLKLDDSATFISGPLNRNEAIAAGYLLETAFISKDILEGNLEIIKPDFKDAFEKVAREIGGQKRFIPLGILTIYDYVARMVHYRNLQPDFPGLDLNEENLEDLALIVGVGVVPLARAFKEDGYVIGDNFQQTIDHIYVGNTNLFIPFAGIFDGHPQNKKDWQMVGLGLHTGVRLFREIEKKIGN